jgi:serine/threonine-protein kinase RsbW
MRCRCRKVQCCSRLSYPPFPGFYPTSQGRCALETISTLTPLEPHLPPKPPTPAADRPVAPRRPRAQSGFALKIDVTIPARISAISPLVEAVVAAVRQHTTSKEMAIETALREALANAVEHGCSGDPSKFVQCGVVFEEDHSVLIVVSDPGPGFNPSRLPDPTRAEHLYKNHGRGIYLIHQLMDEVRFERGGAEIHMRSRF